ncbi:hypothetical protein BH23ACT11_BH23ACT11_29810 [soil metagenome]
MISVGASNGRKGGSGVILGFDGQTVSAVTNSHVVRGIRRASGSNAEIRATLPNGSSNSAEVLGADPPSDLAVIRIAREDDVRVRFKNPPEQSTNSLLNVLVKATRRAPLCNSDNAEQ